MAVIKKGSFVVSGEVGIENKVEQKLALTKVKAPENADVQSLELMKKEYTEQALKIIDEAEEKAEKLLAKSKEEAQKLLDTAKEQSVNLRHTAQQEGYAAGYNDGEAQGKKDAFAQAQEYLDSAKQFLERIQAEKEELFISYENDIFETALDIANKVTLDSLNQKDGRVVAGILKQAAKSFRSSKYLKISLYKNEVTAKLAADADFVKSISETIPHIEIELLKDAEEGTIILDNGSEITDAGVPTQLKMITELGRGKFKNPRLAKLIGEKENAES